MNTKRESQPEQIIQELQENIKYSNISAIGNPTLEELKNGAKEIFEEIMMVSFLKLMTFTCNIFNKIEKNKEDKPMVCMYAHTCL